MYPLHGSRLLKIMKVGGEVMMTRGWRIILFVGLFAFLVLAFGTPAHADPLDTWHVRNKGFASTRGLTSIAFGKETFVAVGTDGKILTSFDSIRWVSRTTPVDGKDIFLSSVIFANNTFVAVGAKGTILISPDGFTWRKASGGTGGRDENHVRKLRCVTFGNGKFVAVGGYGLIMTSDDGTKWKKRRLPIPPLYGVTFGNRIFIAVGEYGTVLTSSDGNSWNQQPYLDTPWLMCVTYGNGAFVAAGGGIFTSPDGIVWTPASPVYPITGWFWGVIFANNTFVVVGGDDGIMTSPDGSTWTAVKSAIMAPIGVAFANNLFVAVGDDGIIASPDGETWSWRRNGSVVAERFHSVTYSQNTFVAIGSDKYMNYGTIVTSPDGVTWVERLCTEYGLPLFSIAYGNNTFVAAGNGLVLTSSDSIEWTQIASPPSISVRAVAFENNTFVAVGMGGWSAVSPDGITWAINTPTNYIDLHSVAFGNNTFVAVGGNGLSGTDGIVATSPDGITWTERTLPTNVVLRGVAYGNNTFVAVGGNPYMASAIIDPIIMTSPDGITWTTRMFPGYWGYYGVTFANNLFVVVGSGGILTSPDGIIWSLREWEYYNYGGHSLFSVAFGNNTFIAVGEDSGFVQSDPVAGDYYNLAVESSGPGTITSILLGSINCRSNCSESFFQNTQVTLLATPDLNSAFTGWTGCDLVNGYICTVTMTSPKNVNAGFITVDLAGPTLIIRKPSDSKTLTAATTLISGTATDSKKGNNGITQVMVNGERATNDTAEGKQKAKWSATIPLDIGSNVINVVATDGAGNTTTMTRMVTRLPESLTISSGIAQNN